MQNFSTTNFIFRMISNLDTVWQSMSIPPVHQGREGAVPLSACVCLHSLLQQLLGFPLFWKFIIQRWVRGSNQSSESLWVNLFYTSVRKMELSLLDNNYLVFFYFIWSGIASHKLLSQQCMI